MTESVDDPEVLDLVAATRGHFALESGHHGDLHLDLDRLLGTPHALDPVLDRLAARVATLEPQVLCGPLTGGAFLAFALAGRLATRFCWSVRTGRDRTSSLHPYGYQVEGDLRDLAGARTVVVDDAINAGSATRATVADLRRGGADAVGAAALLTVGAGARDLCSEEGLALVSLAAVESRLWAPEDCALCDEGLPLVDIA